MNLLKIDKMQKYMYMKLIAFTVRQQSWCICLATVVNSIQFKNHLINWQMLSYLFLTFWPNVINRIIKWKACLFFYKQNDIFGQTEFILFTFSPEAFVSNQWCYFCFNIFYFNFPFVFFNMQGEETPNVTHAKQKAVLE